MFSKLKVLNASGSIDEKYNITIYDIEGIEQYIAEFKAEREDKVGVGERTYGYVKKSRLILLKKNYYLLLINILKKLKIY